MIVGICKLIIAGLGALVEQLELSIGFQLELDANLDLALELAQDPETAEGAASLQAAINCAQANFDLALEVNASGLGPLNKFIELLNAFMSMAGLPEIGGISVGGDASAVLDGLKVGIKALELVCDTIPV